MAKIGIFDSGFGGLSILKHIVELMPQYDYVYLGDSARVPYGNRSSETVYNFTCEALDFLFTQGCDLVVLACNTASSDALRKIQQEFLPSKYPSKKVLGVIIPACETAVETSMNGNIGLIATKGTVSSKAFDREISNRKSDVNLFSIACPLLVPIIENGEHLDNELLDLILNKYLSYFIDKNIDTLILGCTHYALIENDISRVLGTHIAVINEGPVVAKKLKIYLENHSEISSKLSTKETVNFYTTDFPLGFEELGKRFFGRDIEATKIQLQEL